MPFREHVLANGLEIIAEVNEAAYSAAFGFFVKTGSRDETDELSGVTHFLEHMIFKGTPKRTSADVNRELDEIGSESNAFTSQEQTVYYATVLPEYQDRAVELLADIMRPALRDADFDDEKQVILREIGRYEDQPPFNADEKCMAQHFAGHPLARSVLGTTASITALSARQMREYFERRYSPRSISLAAAGNVDFDRLVRSAEEMCGGWPPFEPARDLRRAAPRQGFSVLTKESATQEYVVQLAAGPAAEDDDRYAARLAATVFGDESGSRLFWHLTDKGLAEYAATGTHEFQGSGAFATFLSCAPDETELNLNRLLELQRAFEKQGATAAELAQAQNKICASIVLQSERPSNRMFSIGSHWIQRREYRTVKEVVEAYRGVTLAQLKAVIDRYPLTHNTTICVGPLTHVNPPA